MFDSVTKFNKHRYNQRPHLSIDIRRKHLNTFNKRCNDIRLSDLPYAISAR